MTFQWRSNKADSIAHDSIGKANALQYDPAYNARATRLQARLNSYKHKHIHDHVFLIEQTVNQRSNDCV